MGSCISVCIPVYNEEKTIAGTLESVLHQDLFPRTNLEIFVGANACTDNTEEIVSDYSRRNPNISLISIMDKGKAVMWNILRENARECSPLIAFTDGDVLLDRKAISYLMQKVSLGKSSIVGAKTVPYVDDLPLLERVISTFLFAPQVPWQDGLSGQLYMFNDNLLQERFDKLHIEKMPPSLLSEDFWLRMVAGETFDVELNAKVYYRPFALSESLSIFERYAEGRVQIERGPSEILEYIPPRNISRFAERLKNTPGFTNKISYATGLILRQAIARYTEYKARHSDSLDYDWKVSHRSKRPIPLRVIGNN